MNLIQNIFEDNWDAFVKEIGYENIQKNCHKEVKKVIECSKFENEYLENTHDLIVEKESRIYL